MPEIDVEIDRDGTMFTFTILSEQAMHWVNEHVQTEYWQWLGPRRLVLDHHFAGPVYDGMLDADLEVR